ncbi:response regulator transcription factor [uncultured Pseudokineococcus sp.]|uniref:response regulator transcription factor n=1 Tax=uncultured Pseudokineococcus sp. TaxID=1642928 RepID=UPI0026364E6C|nr:response regulator transcription factor [uncultured Pseudokineococcus sp.]
MSAPVRVVLVDDQPLVRAGFAMVVDSQPDLEVVGQAGDGDAALQLLAQVRADVVLMDVRMPRRDGIEATRELTSRPDAPKVVVLTTFDLDEYVVSAIGAGASGFLLKDAEPEDLLRAIRTVHAGDAVMAASATRALLQHVGPMLQAGPPADGPGGAAPEERAAPAPTVPPADAAALASLTPREREVLELMARGASNSDLMARLFVSEATVKTHVGRVLAKTRSRDRVQAVVLAYRCGLVQPEDLLRDAAD